MEKKHCTVYHYDRRRIISSLSPFASEYEYAHGQSTSVPKLRLVLIGAVKKGMTASKLWELVTSSRRLMVIEKLAAAYFPKRRVILSIRSYVVCLTAAIRSAL